MIWGRILSIIAGVLILSIISTVFPATAGAATDWLNDELVADEIDPAIPAGDCRTEQVPIGGPNAVKQEICFNDANGWRYGTYSQFTQTGPNPWEGYSTNKLVVGFPGEDAMYVVEGISLNYGLINSGASGHIIFNSSEQDEWYASEVSIIKDFPSRLQKTATGYMLKPNSIAPLLPDENGNPTRLKMSFLSVSHNSKWMAVMPEPAGLVRINLQTFEKKWFSKYRIDYSQPHIGTGAPILLVSDNGEYVARSTGGIKPTISKITDSCGRAFTILHSSWMTHPDSQEINGCPERDVSAEISEGIGDPSITVHMTNMSSDGHEIEGIALRYLYDDNNHPYAVADRWFNLHSTGHALPQRLDYLALGDSYSSGEGDTEKNQYGNKYYRPYTDNEENKNAGVPREKCHISTRSYPYKLAQAMDLAKDDPKQWDTIACSGAMTIDVMPKDRASDRGQGNRLAGHDNYAELKTQALNEMIPGRVKQIDFVRKYKPKVITLTMGGNDVGFGDKIFVCVTSPHECEYSQVNYRVKLKKQILDQFDNLSKLYDELANAADGKTKIYVLGYPQFINDDVNAKCNNIFWLDSEERKMAVQAVSFMNDVIQKAAQRAGVYYVDIENSLGNHKLCDSDKEKYMTAITNRLGLNGNEDAESFHPNAKGHQAIANTVRGEGGTDGASLLDFAICPNNMYVCPNYSIGKNDVAIPAYFQVDPEPPNIPKTQSKAITYGNTVASALALVFSGLYTTIPYGLFDVYLHSDPVHLGTFQAKEDGSIDVEIPIPANTTPGYHTLVLKMYTYSGEPIEYEQIILVKSSNPNDVDGDGIDDSQDKCLFVQVVNIDADGDGIDDACDPEIGEAPQDPYRVRAGNPAKTYAGQPEKADNLYIERNKNAAAITGISGDYDADGDGWVVVATSQDTTGTAPYAKFWLTGADGSKVPHISFRTAEQGCVQYKPANLAVVTEQNNNSLRQLAQEAQDTNTCRVEPPEADADGNGAPDNTQPLYMARNGDASKVHTLPNGTTFTEDARHLYLFRSTRAAEAQLGKSDYAKHDSALSPPATIPPTNTTDYRQQWSLIATTNPATPLSFAPSTYIFPYSYSIMNGTYKKIDIVNGQPFVISTTFSSLFFTNCTAYKPPTLATIKQTTQHAQRLTQDWQQTMAVQMGGCI